MWTSRARLALAAAVAGGAVLAGVTLTAPATAKIGDCVSVKGARDSATNGTATVCLRKFDGDAAGSATLQVSGQKRSSAPAPVYVQVRFGYGGTSYDAWRRLGANSPTTGYAVTKTATKPYPYSLQVRLCYDRATDTCYAARSIAVGWVSF